MTYVGKLSPSEALRMTLDVFNQGGSLETQIAGNGPTLRQVIEKALEPPIRMEFTRCTPAHTMTGCLQLGRCVCP